MSKSPNPRQLKLEIHASVNATYANFVLISHSPSEFVLDFAQILPGVPQARVFARIVLTPTNAKLLYDALGANLEKYEAKFSKIKTPPRPPSLADQLFSSVKPPEPPESGGEE